MLSGKLTLYVFLTVGNTTIYLDEVDIKDSTTYFKANSRCIDEVNTKQGAIPEDNIKPRSIKVDLYSSKITYECSYRFNGNLIYIETK